jgi:tRNA threonylcarbamoyladenosine biosynthesis protein TsaE
MTPEVLHRELASRSPEQTLAVAQRIGGTAQPGDCIALIGDLGAGKTVMAKGIADGLGVPPDAVTSPTFVLITRHEGRLPLYHVDAYRLVDASELLAVGAEEALYGEGVAVVEWADRVEELLPEDRLNVRLFVTDYTERRIGLESTGPQSGWLLRAATR